MSPSYCKFVFDLDFLLFRSSHGQGFFMSVYFPVRFCTYHVVYFLLGLVFVGIGLSVTFPWAVRMV